jgi:hypothetical protein
MLPNWIDAMREDTRIAVSVFSKAQAATDFILKTAEPASEPTRGLPTPRAMHAIP